MTHDELPAPRKAAAANVLPPLAVSWLQTAASIDDPQKRRVAVDTATRFTKLNYPTYFKDAR